MKKLLLTLLTGFAIFFNQLYSQCTISGLAIYLRSATTVNSQCQLVFDFSWNQDVNYGNKFAVIHLWRSDQYPALEANGLAYNPPSSRPMNDDLVNDLVTIIIEDNGSNNPIIGEIYYPDPSVLVLSEGLIVHKETTAIAGVFRMTVQNISVTIPSCNGMGLTGDVWSSESDHGQNVHCVRSNVSIIIGNPRVSDFLFCEIPRQYSTQIVNVGDTTITVSYNVYVDEGDAVFEPTVHDTLANQTVYGPYTIATLDTFKSGKMDYLPFSNTKPYSDRGLWIQVITEGFPNTNIYFIGNSCIALPVSFGSFIAKRNGAEVNLKWETFTETNNKGFELQRRTVTGEFQTISSIQSKASDGNSTEKLLYEYGDHNTSTSINIYRIKQIDINGRTTFSESRSVAGLNKENIYHVYPNPVQNKTINIVFADPAKNYDLAFFDQQGRMLRQWRNYNRQYLDLGDIQPGLYTLRIVDITTKATANFKLVVLKQ